MTKLSADKFMERNQENKWTNKYSCSELYFAVYFYGLFGSLEDIFGSWNWARLTSSDKRVRLNGIIMRIKKTSWKKQFVL